MNAMKYLGVALGLLSIASCSLNSAEWRDCGVELPRPSSSEIEVLRSFVPGVHGMAVAEDGVLYFSDSYQHAGSPAQVYTLVPPYSGVPEPTGIVGKNVAGLKWHGGSLFVCVTGESLVQRFDGDLQLQESWQVASPWNLTFIGETAYVVTYGGKVYSLGKEGSSELVVSGLNYPFDIAAFGSSFWVSEQSVEKKGRVRRFDLDGKEIREAKHPWHNPEGLGLDKWGWLYLADTAKGEISRVAPECTVELLSADYDMPIVITEVPGGDLLVSTGGSNARLLRIKFD